MAMTTRQYKLEDGIYIFDRLAFQKAFYEYFKECKDKGIFRNHDELFEEIGDKLGVSPETIRNWKRAKSGPGNSLQVQAVAKCLHIEYKALLKKVASVKTASVKADSEISSNQKEEVETKEDTRKKIELMRKEYVLLPFFSMLHTVAQNEKELISLVYNVLMEYRIRTFGRDGCIPEIPEINKNHNVREEFEKCMLNDIHRMIDAAALYVPRLSRNKLHQLAIEVDMHHYFDPAGEVHRWSRINPYYKFAFDNFVTSGLADEYIKENQDKYDKLPERMLPNPGLIKNIVIKTPSRRFSYEVADSEDIVGVEEQIKKDGNQNYPRSIEYTKELLDYFEPTEEEIYFHEFSETLLGILKEDFPDDFSD